MASCAEPAGRKKIHFVPDGQVHHILVADVTVGGDEIQKLKNSFYLPLRCNF
jgi:hypothetical protein